MTSDRRLLPGGILLAMLVLVPTPASALSSTPPSGPAQPPVLDRVFPSGGQRGQTIAVTAEGQFGTWPVRVGVEGRGVEVRPDEAPGKLIVTVAPDAVGVAWIRLWNDQGASELRPFLVGSLPEAIEVEPNDSPTAAQGVASRPVTINGRLAKNGDVDGYSVPLQAGQTLIAALVAHEVLAAPMDAVLQVARPDGLVLEQVDDSGGLDPRLVFVAPVTGTYVVRTFAFPAEPSSSIQFAGGNAFVYRLTLTTDAFADYPWPLSVQHGRLGTVDIVGWNLPPEARQLTIRPSGPGLDQTWVDHPALAEPVLLRVVSHPVALESRPTEADPSPALAAPMSLTGRISTSGERDVYRFAGKAGQPRLIRVAARSLGFPLDPVLRVLDSAGKLLAEADDLSASVRDPELRFTPPTDGEYRIEITDLNGRGGSRYVYQLDLMPVDPEVRLTVGQRQLTLLAEKPLEVAVGVERRNGFAASLDVAVEGLPDHVTASHALSVPGAGTAKAVTLTLTSRRATTWSGPIRIVGRPHSPELASVTATTSESNQSATRLPWLTVVEPKETSDDPSCLTDW